MSLKGGPIQVLPLNATSKIFVYFNRGRHDGNGTWISIPLREANPESPATRWAFDKPISFPEGLSQIVVVIVVHSQTMGVLGHLRQGRRFEHDENEANLEEATSAISESIQLSPPDDEVLATRFWQLGALLTLRFNHTGDPDAIRAVVTAQKKAVELATTANSPSLPLYLEGLGFSGTRLFMRCKVPADLEESMSTLERAIELTPVDETEAEALCSRLGRLGTALLLKHGLTHQLSDVQAAVDARKRVVDLTPKNFEAYPARLSLLADALGHRFYQTRKIEDSDLEVATREQVIEVSPKSGPDLWRCYSYLGTTLLDRFVRTEKVEDIRRSIANYREAIRIAIEDATVLPTLLDRLGTISGIILHGHRRPGRDRRSDLRSAQGYLDVS
ncbi:hypothetical protein EST38_g14472 [Candolleomyces aberdarensis]|uniref:Uncharacterized protein n=1 Tax=Candolleomyces aberdarensis TaxID=2316362 RepID=A0A4Q2CXA2_9AGAR|nr:hypothetical protein EST38_g14472 [Candolleomyces aberdarensis]